jgi:formyltetrahydrofolate-dependent phosphoribosylglycinamide formyltransferase
MIHNKEKCGAAKRADKLGIPHSYINSKNETNIIRLIQAWNVDLIVLAGWMRIVTKDFIDAFRGRIINVHPSLLPKYKGLNTHERVINNSEKYSGCTVHFVNSKLDSGKIILQKKVKIDKKDTPKTLAKKVLKQEHIAYPKALIKLISNL